MVDSADMVTKSRVSINCTSVDPLNKIYIRYIYLHHFLCSKRLLPNVSLNKSPHRSDWHFRVSLIAYENIFFP